MAPAEDSWLTGPVLKALRVLSGLSAQQLAERAAVGEATVKRAEASSGAPRLTAANRASILRAYERLGIEIDAVEDSPAYVIRVRLGAQPQVLDTG